MKKITLILTVFILILSTQSYAQEATPPQRNVDQVEYDYDKRDFKKAKKGNKKRGHKHAKQRKRENNRQLKAMRKVAKADGTVTPNEKKVIRSEKRKMKRKGKRRAHERKERRMNEERTSDFEPRRN